MENYIELGGEKRPLYFGLKGINKFCKIYNISLAEFASAFSSLDMDEATQMIVISLNEGERRAKGKNEYSYDEVCDWLDESFDEFGKATQIIMENLPFKTDEEKAETTEGNAPKVVKAKS